MQIMSMLCRLISLLLLTFITAFPSFSNTGDGKVINQIEEFLNQEEYHLADSLISLQLSSQKIRKSERDMTLFYINKAKLFELDASRLNYDSAYFYYSLGFGSPIISTINKINLANYIAEFFRLNFTHHLDSSYYYHDLAIRLNTPLIDKAEKLRSYRGLGMYYLSIGNPEKAIGAGEKALALDSTFLGAYTLLGAASTQFGQLAQAIEYFLQALGKEENLDFKTRISLKSHLAIAYASVDQYNLSLEYFFSAIEDSEAINDHWGKSWNLFNIGDMYLNMDSLDLAEKYFLETYEAFTTRSEGCDHIFPGSGLIQVYLSKGDYESARHFLSECYRVGEGCDALDQLSFDLLLASAEIKFVNKEINGAIKDAHKAFLNAVRNKDREYKKQASQILYELYKSQNNSIEALRYLEINKIQSDSLLNSETLMEVSRIKAKYQFKQEKDSLNYIRTLEQSRYNSEIVRRNTLQYVSILVISFLVLLMLIIYRSYHRKKRSNQIIEEQNKKITRASEQLRNANIELIQLSNFKENMNQMIAHDMKNGLHAIMGISTSDNEGKRMDQIQKIGNSILLLVNNMLDTQRFQEAKVVLDIKRCTVGQLCNEVLDQVNPSLENKSIQLKIEADPELNLYIDLPVMIRVLINLITNSIKNSEKGSVINLTFRMIEESKIEIIVQDHGCGISQKDLPFIFDRFWNSSMKIKDRSSGLGLTFCKMAIEAHDGSISASSNEFTKIKIVFPQSQVKNQEEQLIDKHNAHLIFPSEEIELKKLALNMFEIESFEIGKLQPIIHNLEHSGLKSPWIAAIKLAIETGDQEKYNELSSMLT